MQEKKGFVIRSRDISCNRITNPWVHKRIQTITNSNPLEKSNLDQEYKFTTAGFESSRVLPVSCILGSRTKTDYQDWNFNFFLQAEGEGGHSPNDVHILPNPNFFQFFFQKFCTSSRALG